MAAATARTGPSDTVAPASDSPASESAPRLTDGPADAPATLLLAHGAGAPMDSPFMQTIATGLAAQGWRVVRFEFPYMARARLTGRRAGPDRLPKLLEAFREQVALEAGDRPLFLGGKSLGGRVASLLLDALAEGNPAAGKPATEAEATSGAGRDGSSAAMTPPVIGAICLGYPFHPPGKPLQLRTEHLQTLRTPALILQGERDPFGRPEEVAGYALSPQVQLQWIPHGDHSFTPTRSSGLSEADNWALAVAHADRFCRSQLNG